MFCMAGLILYSVNNLLHMRAIFSDFNAVIDCMRGRYSLQKPAFTAGYRYLNPPIAKGSGLNDKLIVKSVTIKN
ncbi:conserved protein of unknown function [Serratia sp. Tan611]|nr:conserved protein of unknown function [Serratia sp. Tan611]